MIADMKDSANVQNCGHTFEEKKHKEVQLKNEFGGNEVYKKCPPGYDGETCDNLFDVCVAHEPCENGATCITKGTEYTCMCPVGFTGTNCERVLNLKFEAHFKGNSYLELDKMVLANSSEVVANGLAIMFSTTQPNGLLIWWGQNKGVGYDTQDFVALALVDGFLEYSFRLNDQESVIKNVFSRVDDGERHIVVLKRNENQASMEVDHFTQYGESRPTERKIMHLPGNIFLGE
jgi:Laminin G domain/EGF-like domain